MSDALGTSSNVRACVRGGGTRIVASVCHKMVQSVSESGHVRVVGDVDGAVGADAMPVWLKSQIASVCTVCFAQLSFCHHSSEEE